MLRRNKRKKLAQEQLAGARAAKGSCLLGFPILNLYAAFGIVNPIFQRLQQDMAQHGSCKTNIKGRNVQIVSNLSSTKIPVDFLLILDTLKGVVKCTQPGLLASQKCELRRSRS